MEMAFDKKEGIITRSWELLRALPGKLLSKFVEFEKKTRKLGEDDPRRIIHSLKVGLAIILVSSFYYFEPLYAGFGVSAMWAVMTVVVVFEFSIGATFSRGINRSLASILAAALGFGAHRLASLSGDKCEPILLGIFVFVLGAAVTFLRFSPGMKARYDYGLMIFILTFSLISVSAYRDDEVLDMACRRISTILIGGFTALFVCIFICPVWAGEDLHNLVANNIEKLANFLECFGTEYFKISEDGKLDKTFLEGYKTVLNSKQTEESLANFARWEPGHRQFRFGHPWKQYLEIGNVTRHCAYRIEALNGYLTEATVIPPEIRCIIQGSCLNLCSESAKALKELALAMKTMTTTCSSSSHITKSKMAATNLKSLLNTGLCKKTKLLEVIPAVTMTSLLIDVVSYAEKILDCVQELASLAQFQHGKPKLALPEHVITIHQPSSSAE